MSKHSIIIVGPFPPPVTGLSTINERMLNKIESQGINVIKLDTSAGIIERNLGYIFRRIKSILRVMFYLIRYKAVNNTSLYCSVSGNLGKIFEIIFITIARLKMMKTFHHHHSFLYINRNQFFASLLFRISGENSIHISLSDRMGELLKEKYNTILNTISISNVNLINNPKNIKNNISNETIKTIGFLSNISFEKGIDTFIKLVEAIQNNDYAISALIAGPFQDSKIEKFVLSEISENKSIKYIGPLYNEKKLQFFRNIDLFVLPSIDEAEPLVIYESLMNGVPVIAFGVGCVPEQIGNSPKVGLSINPTTNFIEESLPWIHSRIKSTNNYVASSRAALNRYQFLQQNAKDDFAGFLSAIQK